MHTYVEKTDNQAQEKLPLSSSVMLLQVVQLCSVKKEDREREIKLEDANVYYRTTYQVNSMKEK